MTLERSKVTATDVATSPVSGGGWVAHFPARGYDVTNSLHDKTEIPTFMTIIETVWENLIELGFVPGTSMAWLKIAGELETAVGDAGFVQKSISENLPPSQAPYQRFGEIEPPDVVIGSSTLDPAVKPRPRMSNLPC